MKSRKVLAVFLALVMFFSIMPLNVSAQITESGKAGEEAYYTYDDTDTLRIYGKGSVTKLFNSDSWYPGGYHVKHIVIEEGITELCSEFCMKTPVQSIDLPDSLEIIGAKAFSYCENLTSITFPPKITKIPENCLAWDFNVRSIDIPKSVTEIGKRGIYVAKNSITGSGSCSLTSINFQGNEEEWKKIKIGENNVTNVPINYLTYKGEKINPNSIHYIPGYNPDTDKYGFINTGWSINQSVYKKVLGNIWGTIFYAQELKGDHGCCYGMSATTQSIIRNKSILDYAYEDVTEVAVGAGYLKRNSMIRIEAPERTYFTDTTSTLLDYVKAAHVYQNVRAVEKERSDNMNDISALWETVKNLCDNSGSPVIIDFFSKLLHLKKHSISAVGYKETEDNYVIIVDNPNKKELTEFKISKDFKSWECDGYSSSDNAVSFNTADVSSLRNITDFVASSKGLLIRTSVDLSEDKNYIEAFQTNGYDSTSANEENLYWTTDDVKELNFEIKQNNRVTVASYASSITVDFPNQTSFRARVTNEGDNAIEYSLSEDEIANITFSFSNDLAQDIVEISVLGTASGGLIKAKETENGLSISGIKEGSVIAKINDTSQSKRTFKNSSNIVEITFNKNDLINSFDVSRVEKDYKTENETCKCACHDNGFLKIIWFFINLLNKLFKENQYCVCGAKHW